MTKAHLLVLVMITVSIDCFADKLLIRSNPSSAKILVNGVDQKLNTPSMVAGIKTGDSVRLERNGCEQKIVSITEVMAGSKQLNIELACSKKVSDLVLITDPSGASIYLDGTYVGLSPFKVKAGDLLPTYRLTIKKAGYEEVQVTPGEEKRLNLKLKPVTRHEQ